jgi:uncharacterized LabA/DUF88 family protein
VDFENFYYAARSHGQALDVAKLARGLTRLCREASGQTWVHQAVYASWDRIHTTARHAQDEWAMMGWSPVVVPAREDYQSQRTIKNLVDFVMSLDILEHARDRPIEHFYIASGDGDFGEVVQRLKRLGKWVTVVALKANLNYRLQEAADDYVVCGLEDITGSSPLPPGNYRHMPMARSQAVVQEDPFLVLRRAIREAEKDGGRSPAPWVVVRDEYFLRMTTMLADEADRFVRDLSEAGFVTLVSRKDARGRSISYLSVPQ